MRKISDKMLRIAVRIGNGDLGINQSAEVGGLVAVSIGVTGAIVAKSDQIGTSVTTFLTKALT